MEQLMEAPILKSSLHVTWFSSLRKQALNQMNTEITTTNTIIPSGFTCFGHNSECLNNSSGKLKFIFNRGNVSSSGNEYKGRQFKHCPINTI